MTFSRTVSLIIRTRRIIGATSIVPNAEAKPCVMEKNMKAIYRKLIIVVIAITANQMAIASSWSDVAINGQRLTTDQLRMLEQQVGGKVAPGIYLADANGCWLNLSNATSGCLGQGNVSTFSRYGSGERNANGDWNHYSRAAELGVGGTSDGCIYTTSGWSNC